MKDGRQKKKRVTENEKEKKEGGLKGLKTTIRKDTW
jgi:hypothetical protein